MGGSAFLICVQGATARVCHAAAASSDRSSSRSCRRRRRTGSTASSPCQQITSRWGEALSQASGLQPPLFPPPLLPSQGLIEVRVVLGGPSASLPTDVQLRLRFNGAAPGPATSVPVVNGTAVLAAVPVPGFKLWTIGQGNLFTLTVRDPRVCPPSPPGLGGGGLLEASPPFLLRLPSSNRSRRWPRATR